MWIYVDQLDGYMVEVELSWVCFNLDAFITRWIFKQFFLRGKFFRIILFRAGLQVVWRFDNNLPTSTANEPTIDSLTEFCLHDLWLVKVMLLKDTSTEAGIQWSTGYRFLYSFCKWWLSYANTLFTRQARVFFPPLGLIHPFFQLGNTEVPSKVPCGNLAVHSWRTKQDL